MARRHRGAPRAAGARGEGRRRRAMGGGRMPPGGQNAPRRGLLSGHSTLRPTSSPRPPRSPARRMDDRAEDDAYGPYQPYRPYTTEGRLSSPSGVGYRGTTGRLPAASAELAVPQHHHLGISIFHDGHLGHLWRGEFFSRLGAAVLGVGLGV